MPQPSFVLYLIGLAAIFSVTAPAESATDIYKCVLADGEVSFQGRPCQAGADQETLGVADDIELASQVTGRTETQYGANEYRDGIAVIRPGERSLGLFMTVERLSVNALADIDAAQPDRLGQHVALVLIRRPPNESASPGDCQLETASLRVWSGRNRKARIASGTEIIEAVSVCSVEQHENRLGVRLSLRYSGPFTVSIDGLFPLQSAE